jgi:hypothetical protein
MPPYFGYSDAADEVNLKDYFVRSPLFHQMKKGDLTEGIFVVHGIKGAGKTALCNMIQMENEQEALVLKIDKAFGFDIRKLDANSAAVEGLMLTLLMKELIKEIKAKKSLFSSQALKKIESSEEKVKKFLSRIPGAIKGKVGPLEVDLSKLLDEDVVASFSRFQITDYVDTLTPALKERQAYILIDDVDDVFAGADRNADFLEGLLRAAKEINKAFGHLIHCLIFLKSGVFKLLFENANEYDKLRDYIAASISWDKNGLTSLLAVRIRQIHKQKDIDTASAWELDFDGKGSSIKDIQDHIVSRCVSGPRDLIVYCNMAKEKAGNSRIGMQHIQDVEGVYSKEKLATINRDFGRTYPRIQEFLQQLFSGEKQIYTNEQIFGLLRDKVIISEPFKKIFSKEEYVVYATKEKLIELLYSIGFIGFKKTKSSPLEFVITNPDPDSQMLYKASEYRIHHAYKQYLNLIG